MSKTKVYIPLLLALFFAAGIFIGINFLPKNTTQSNVITAPNSKFATILSIIEDRYVDSVDHNKLIESSIAGMITKLDPHSRYIPPQDLGYENEQLSGKFGGIGIRFLIHEDTLVVTDVLPKSPSEFAGLKAGDRIIEVDDSVLVNQKLNNEIVMSLLKGLENTSVKLKVYRKGKIKPITIIRGSIPVNSIVASLMLNKTVGFIKLSSFTNRAGDEFVEAAQKLRQKGMEKLIFDLRNNGGGYMHAATQIIDQFLDGGKLIVYTEGRMEGRKDYVSTNNGVLKDVKLIVLINANSASASEIVAGAIQDNDRGFIYGRRSFGKGLVQDQREFNDGSALRLTISRYYTPTGRSIQKPYGDDVDYENDYLHRYESGELLNEDSVKFDESLKYTTPAGRTVYGGGGIYPDVFIPNDTTGGSYYLTELYYASAFNHWAFKVLDNERSRWKNLNQFNKSFQVSDNILKLFCEYSEKTLDVKIDLEGLSRSKAFIKNRIKAEMARHLFAETGFYKIYLNTDSDVKKALTKWR